MKRFETTAEKREGGILADPSKGKPSAVQASLAVTGNTMNAEDDVNITAIGKLKNTVNNFYHNQTPISTLDKLERILNPVATAAYDSYVSKAEQCFEGTRVRVLEEIWDWVNGNGSQASIYVLDGVAGIGKSTVAQTVAYKAAKEGILGGSFFFSSDEQERQTTQHFVPTIAYQLASHNDKFARYLVANLKQHPGITKKNLKEQLKVLVLDPLKKLRNPLQRLLPITRRPTLIVIDALDECDVGEAKLLLDRIVNDFQVVLELKVFITTRPEFHIRQVLDHQARDQPQNHERFRLHEIEDSIVQADIRMYLQFRLSSDEIQRQLPGIGFSWHLDSQEMDMLCGLCGSLFIIASTAIKFILDDRRLNPRHQLSQLLNGVSPETFSGSSRTDAMDKIYLHVLLSALPDNQDFHHDGEDWIAHYQTVLGAIVTLQNPLPCQSLAELLDVAPDFIDRILVRLHSLIAPKGSDRIYRIHHKTFPDFITHEGRIRKACCDLAQDAEDASTVFLVDTQWNHLQLAKQCFRVMKDQLKRNLCGLRGHDMYKDNEDVRHLLLSPTCALAYACTHWAHHVNILSKSGGLDNELKQCVEVWQATQLLIWLEALSIFGKIDSADDILEMCITSIESLSGTWPEADGILRMLKDARDLVAQNIVTLKLSSMNVYWSLIPFMPTNTRLYEKYGHADDESGPFDTQRNWSCLVATLKGHPGLVFCVAFSCDGSRIASGSTEKTVRLWDGKTGAHIATLKGHSNYVFSVAFSVDGSILASGSGDKTIRLWDGKTGAHIANLKGHSGFVRSVAFSSDGLRLASGSDDKTVWLWDGMTGAHIATLKGHSNYVLSVAFSGDGSRLASGSLDKTVRLWDGKTGSHIATLKGFSDWVRSVAFSSDGSVLASASGDGTIRMWNGRSGVHNYTFIHNTISYVRRIAFPWGHTTHGRRLFGLVERGQSNLHGVVALTDGPDGRWDYSPFLWLPPHLKPYSLAVNSTGSSIAVGCENGQLLLLDISNVAFP